MAVAVAARINCSSVQNTINFLNPLHHSFHSKAFHLKTQLHFRRSPLCFSGRAVFCSSSINSQDANGASAETFVLTTPLYYVNAPPHMGSAYTTIVEKSRIHYENLSLSLACEAVLEIGNAGNSYMDEHAPWSLFKQGGAVFEAAAKDLVMILEAMRIIAIALSPVTPSLCWRIYARLGYTKDQFDAATWSDTKWGGLKRGQVMAQPKPVFARIENEFKAENGAEAVKVEVKRKEKLPNAQRAVEA